jgi:RimJ/RimL family protein N-acetyltransferase
MTDRRRFPGPAPVRLEGEGLVLREWSETDLPRMVELFDEPGFRRWTPLASPFDLVAAQAYLDRSRARREEGSALQLAITTDGAEALGEVLIFLHPDVAELGWGLGAAHRGRRLASRAVRVMLTWAATNWGLDRFRALIEPGNAASERVAAACGFVASSGTPILVESRGHTVGLTAWLLPEDRVPGRRTVASEAPECR